MAEDTLVNAMRLGSRSPLEERDASDLGRFGLGLKTASFSQARRLTVISQPEPVLFSAASDILTNDPVNYFEEDLGAVINFLIIEA